MSNIKTIKQLAQDALDVQNASNLCGVAQSFAKAMIDLGEYCKGTKERNEHVITKAWVQKLAYLSGGLSPYTIADDCKTFDALEDLANGNN